MLYIRNDNFSWYTVSYLTVDDLQYTWSLIIWDMQLFNKIVNKRYMIMV